MDQQLFDVQAALQNDDMLNPADVRLWDKAFEAWKNHGFPNDPNSESPMPGDHPIAEHPWNKN